MITASKPRNFNVGRSVFRSAFGVVDGGDHGDGADPCADGGLGERDVHRPHLRPQQADEEAVDAEHDGCPEQVLEPQRNQRGHDEEDQEDDVKLPDHALNLPPPGVAFSWSEWVSVVRENEARTGLVIAVIAFASFFTQLALADEHDKTGLHISVIVTLIASSFAIGGAASRAALEFVSRPVALRLWNGGIVLFALLALIASVLGSAAWMPLCLSCLLALCAGALTPIATFMTMGQNSASAPRALAILGATKMAVSSVIAYSLSASEMAPFLLTGVIVFALTLLSLGLTLSLKGKLGH